MEGIKMVSCLELTTMKRYICTLIVTSFVTLGHVFAHEDFYATNDFGNVKVRIKTGFEYEEINNVALLGQLAEKLCKKFNYSEPIFLDFSHYYTGNCTPDFFISYDKVNNEYLKWGGNSNKSLFWDDNKVVFREVGNFLDGNAIVIRQIARHFQARTTMKLLEYAILNLKNIKSTQTQIEYNKNYCQWKINSIDTLIIKEMLNTPNSDLLNDILKVRIYRDEKDFGHGISYYLQDNRYYVFQKGLYQGLETVLFDFENIYDFKKFGKMLALIFDTDSSFYYVKQSGIITFANGGGSEKGPQISKRHVINNFGTYKPYDVTNIGDGKVVISFWYWKSERDENDTDKSITIGDKQKTLIYFAEDDRLYDLDKVLRVQID